MIQESVIPITFTSGVETKSDPKTVLPAKLLRLENAVFTKPGQVAKRNGYTALGTAISDGSTLTAPQMAHGYNNELICADQGVLLSYSSNQDAWTPKGNYASVELKRSLISEDIGASGMTSVAILGNYALYAWSDTTGTSWASVVDLSTGDVLNTRNLFVNGSFVLMDVRCVLLGGTTLCVVYQKGAGEYGARTVAFPGGGVINFSVETVITTNSTGLFDIIPTTTGGAFVYTQSTGPGITVATLSIGLAVTTVNIATTATQNIAISSTSNNNLWVYWNETTNDGSGNLTASSLYYAVYTAVLTPVLAKTLIIALGSPYYTSNLMAKGDSATQETLYYGQFITNNHGSKHEIEYSNYITVTSAGVIGSPTLFANGVIPFSHPFTVGTKTYAVFYYRSSDITVAIGGNLPAPVQPTYFIVELTNLISPPYVVARFAAGVASSYNGFLQTHLFTMNVAAFSATKFYFGVGLEVQEFSNPSNFIGGLLASFAYSFDFSSENANVAKNVDGVVALNGAVMQLYDGLTCTEFGFHLFPEITNLADASTGGNIANGTYNYIAIYSWIDDQGNLHQSAPSIPVSVVVADGTSTSAITVSVTTNYLSQKQNAWVAIFRTQTLGSIYYLVSNPVFVTAANPRLGAIVTFVDTLADATIINNNQAYTYPASPVLENSTPPPSMVMLAHNNRLWFVDSENPNTIWYTKSGTPLVGLSPSAFLIDQIDPKFGDITALAEMDEKLVAGKANGFLVQSGDGADDTGNNSSLSFPQTVPSDVGVTTLKSVITTPRGVMFKSPNGIYMLDRSLNVSYIGAEVEAYNAQLITGANLVPGKSQIRFLCSTGLTLVYDYIFNQWSTFTAHTGLSSSTWNSLYVYVTTAGRVFKESLGVYLDNASSFALLLQTSWLALGSIQGFQRVRRLIMLGDFVNGNSASHNLSIAAAYDFSPTFQPSIASPPFGAISASGVFQYRERLPIQKCDSIALLIQETTTGSSAEYVDLTNISFEAGVKKGVNKLAGLQSVG